MGERIVDSRKKVVEKAKIVRKQLKELYEEKNRGEGWDWNREKQGGVFHL